MHRNKTVMMDIEHAKYIVLTCPNCNAEFERLESYIRAKQSQGQGTFCSRKCAGIHGAAMNGNGVTQEDICKIKELRSQKLSVYKISEMTGFARNTVMKYW
jgi:hypothetical protein